MMGGWVALIRAAALRYGVPAPQITLLPPSSGVGSGISSFGTAQQVCPKLPLPWR